MRYLQVYVENDLNKKMVFISGPRQCGKTTFVQELLKSKPHLYLNWDDLDHRKIILKRDWSDEDRIIALDEIHKYSRWKNFLKGTYDTQKEKHRFIVTGSAKLDTYKKGQDSMMGRFFSWKMYPLCVSELSNFYRKKADQAFDSLLEYGNFPEPFFTGDLSFSKRWRKERFQLVFRNDIRENENLRDVSLLEVFYQMLLERAGSEIVLSNLARDLEIAPKTAKNWLSILEKNYSIFVVPPFSKGIAKAIVKAPKVFFYDLAEVNSSLGAKFENAVAFHLIKKIDFLNDSRGESYELNYVRERNAHEVDFLILKNRKPHLLIEVKQSETARSPSLYYFMKKMNLDQSIQLVEQPCRTTTKDGIRVTQAAEWLSRPLDSDFLT